jgi:ABC-2 type transport system permease protein
MLSLIRIEWLKMRKYNAFWWLMGITALSYPGINFMFYQGYKNMVNQPTQASQLAKIAIGNPFTFPEVWHTVAYFSSIFLFIPAVLVIMFVSNEYIFRTHRQNIIDGWSRSQFISSKLADVLIVSVIITLVYAIAAYVTGMVNQERLISETWSQSYYIGLFFLQTFAQLSIAFLVGFMIRKPFIALSVFLFYSMILEPIGERLLHFFVNDAGKFLPLEISDRLVPAPAFIGKINPESYKHSLEQINEHIVFTIILTSIIWSICYAVHKKRDLK